MRRLLNALPTGVAFRRPDGHQARAEECPLRPWKPLVAARVSCNWVGSSAPILMVWNVWTTDSWSLYVRYGLTVRDIAQASSLGGKYPAEMRERAVRMVREGEAAFGSEGDLVWAVPDRFGSAETVGGWVRRGEIE